MNKPQIPNEISSNHTQSMTNYGNELPRTRVKTFAEIEPPFKNIRYLSMLMLSEKLTLCPLPLFTAQLHIFLIINHSSYFHLTCSIQQKIYVKLNKLFLPGTMFGCRQNREGLVYFQSRRFWKKKCLSCVTGAASNRMASHKNFPWTYVPIGVDLLQHRVLHWKVSSNLGKVLQNRRGK